MTKCSAKHTDTIPNTRRTSTTKTITTTTKTAAFLLTLLLTCTTILKVTKAANTSTTASSSSSSTYDAKVSRRERNLDHWDAETMAAYLGLDPDTAQPLPQTETNSDGSSTGTGGTYSGIDASIMFYAQWCSNCHKFAPLWDTIATLLHAGTTKSNLIMALFNCELNDQHVKLCDAAGIKQYPTLMYVGAGPYRDTDPISSLLLGGRDKSAGPAGSAKLSRTVKFQGDLNVGDSVLDWVKTMRGLSTWYKWNYSPGGWLTFLRRGLGALFYGGKRGNHRANAKSTANALPIGVPPSAFGSTSASPLGGGGGGGTATSPVSAYATQKALKEAEKKYSELEGSLEEYKMASTHAGYLIDSFLFPVQDAPSPSDDGSGEEGTADSAGNQSVKDLFAKITETDAWDIKAEDGGGANMDALVLRSCMVDLALDYCTRLSTKVTTEYVQSLKSVSDADYPSFVTMETELKDIIKKTEPYCSIFHPCYKNDFLKTGKDDEDDADSKENQCRPSTCPFKNEKACHYVASCFSSKIKEEYESVLEKQLKDLPAKDDTATDAEAETNVNVEAGNEKKTKVTTGGWGLKK